MTIAEMRHKQVTTHAAGNVMQPLSGTFVCAVVIAGLTRLLEVYFLASSTQDGLIILWQSPHLGIFGIADTLAFISILLLMFSVLQAFQCLRSVSAWTAVAICLILTCYTAGISYLSNNLAVHYSNS